MKISAQFTPSVYTGFSIISINTGGLFGVGSELKYKFISLNVAAGHNVGLSKKQINYDVGMKIYSKMGIVAGINYSCIGVGVGNLIFNTNTKYDIYGFSFSAGYRRTIYKHLYGMAFIGHSTNILIKNEEDHRAHIQFGAVFGYEF